MVCFSIKLLKKMDIYEDDIDSILGNDALNENINNDDDAVQANGSGTEENENDEPKDGDGQKVEPKRRTVRNPQLRLNVARLQGERGVHTLEDYFKDIKYMGKGHEKQDLKRIMKGMEHWAHRLYPAFNFDDFLTTTEKLGKKKQIQTYMYRYRQGMLESQMNARNELESNDQSDNEDNGNNAVEPIDEYDYLIGQQIEKYKTLPPRTPGHETTFDSIRSSVMPGTPTFMGRLPVEASTPMSNMRDIQPLPLTPYPNPPKKSVLTSEQMAKIAENRRLAQERLKAKMAAKAIAAQPVTISNTNTEEFSFL